MADRRIIFGGDLFASGCSTLVNAVNCRGVMGAGIALEFKRRFPAMFEDYRCRCDRGEVALGHPYLWRNPDGPSVLNFPTKDDWRNGSELRWIEEGLAHLGVRYREWGIESIAFPALGCGRGGLRWEEVCPVLVGALASFEIPVRVFAPGKRGRSQGCSLSPSKAVGAGR